MDMSSHGEARAVPRLFCVYKTLSRADWAGCSSRRCSGWAAWSIHHTDVLPPQDSYAPHFFQSPDANKSDLRVQMPRPCHPHRPGSARPKRIDTIVESDEEKNRTGSNKSETNLQPSWMPRCKLSLLGFGSPTVIQALNRRNLSKCWIQRTLRLQPAVMPRPIRRANPKEHHLLRNVRHHSTNIARPKSTTIQHPLQTKTYEL